MDMKKNKVSVARRPCKVTQSTLEEIVCETSTSHEVPTVSASSVDSPASLSFKEYHYVTGGAVTQGTWETVNGGADADYILTTDPHASVSFIPSLPKSGAYQVKVQLPPNLPDDHVASSRLTAVVRNNTGYVIVNATIEDGASEVDLGIMYLAGGVHGAGKVVISAEDSAGRGHSLAVVSVSWEVVVQWSLGSCSDAQAINAGGPGSCVYDGGRGIQSQQWSSLLPSDRLAGTEDKNDEDPYATGVECPDELHSQCGEKSFCCTDDSWHGCKPHYKVENSGNWTRVFWQRSASRYKRFEDIGVYAAPGLQHRTYHDSILARASLDKDQETLFSRLSEWPKWRRNDGYFHFKLCWPESDLECVEWMQTHDPTTSPWVRDVGLVLLNSPYEDDAPFHGLTASFHGQALLDGQMGEEDLGLYNVGQYCTKTGGISSGGKGCIWVGAMLGKWRPRLLPLNR